MQRLWTIFLLLVAALPAQAALELYFVHNDHLGTPQVITSKNAQVVWKGHMKPFGEMDVEVEEVTNLRRFPGQWYDIETGLHYNYFRDYDPGLGRYVQSDPIGLQGGLNIYNYANVSPQIYQDRFGLMGARAERKISNHPAERMFWDGADSTRCRLRCFFDPTATIAGESAKYGFSRAGSLGKALGSRANIGVQVFGMSAAWDCGVKCFEKEKNACFDLDSYNPYTMTLSR